MDIEVILLKFQSLIKDELHKLATENSSQQFCHNHPPVKFIVQGCLYCKKHGNCFHKN